MSWIYSQILKETLSEINENDWETVKNYCQDLYIHKNTFDLILKDRTLIEDYDSLCEMTIDSNSFIALANLLLDKKDYDRAEQFYLKDLELENDTGLHQVKILNKLSQLFAKKNQLDKAKQYYQQANAIKQQYSSK